jgi:hypothetical protein
LSFKTDDKQIPLVYEKQNQQTGIFTHNGDSCGHNLRLGTIGFNLQGGFSPNIAPLKPERDMDCFGSTK